MIAWWWLLIVGPVSFSIGVTTTMRFIRRGIGKMIEKPPSIVRQFLDNTFNVVGNQTFETSAELAETHQKHNDCPQNCGTRIAETIREVQARTNQKK